MVKPVKSNKKSIVPEQNEETMNEVEENKVKSNVEKVELDINDVKKNKQFNQFASTDKQKDSKKVKLTPKKLLKKKKGIEKALNRIEKDNTFLEKKQKKSQTKKRWNALY